MIALVISDCVGMHGCRTMKEEIRFACLVTYWCGIPVMLCGNSASLVEH